MKVRKRLYPEEAKLLGFKPRTDKGRKTSVYALDPEQIEELAEVRNESETVPNDYQESAPFVMSAWDETTGQILSVKDFCKKYGLPAEDVTSSKFLPYHYNNIPTYHIVFKEKIISPFMDMEEVKEVISERLERTVRPITEPTTGKKSGVVKIADLHLGAEIENLLRTKDFNIEILRGSLHKAAGLINRFNYDIVHVHILGDLIESFTGLNHKNSWKGLNKNLVGAEAVIMAVKVLENDFLSLINNLGSVKMIAGNHDRVTSDNKEDTQGDAAKLIAWGLELRGFDIEFNPKVITHEVDGICHILAHGHLSMTKDTKSMCWDYGVQGKYNLLTMGHLHSLIKMLSENQKKNFKVVKDDSIDSRAMYCNSFFTGNDFSEGLGYASNAGFHIVEDNGSGRPHIFDLAL